MQLNFTLPKEPVYTVAANNGNEITKEYYNMLIGPINNGEIFKAVCRIYYPKFDYTTYHLISI